MTNDIMRARELERITGTLVVHDWLDLNRTDNQGKEEGQSEKPEMTTYVNDPRAIRETRLQYRPFQVFPPAPAVLACRLSLLSTPRMERGRVGCHNIVLFGNCGREVVLTVSYIGKKGIC
jgi:hypothetical protein